MDYNYTLIFIIAIFLTTTMFNLILYFGFNRKAAYLYFSLYCISHVLKISLKPSVIQSSGLIISESLRGQLVIAVILAGGVFLLAFLLDKFSIPKRNSLLSGIVLFSFLAFFMSPEGWYIVLMTIAAFAIAAYAWYLKMEGSILSLIGLVGFSFFTYLGYQDLLNFGYFVGIIFFIICMTLSLGKQIAQQNRHHQEAILRSARLENQLLKKNIQPHFLMNSLTSLQELLVENPRQASEFIDALADEFRIFSQIADEKLISIADEFTICRNHLKIMEYRKNSRFEFEPRGFSGEEKVPPAIFHTLIENGITHGYGNKNQGKFILSKETNANGIRYTMFNDGECRQHQTDNPIGQNGTGLKYIEARLEESYPGAWRLESSRVEGGWQVQISISGIRSS